MDTWLWRVFEKRKSEREMESSLPEVYKRIPSKIVEENSRNLGIQVQGVENCAS